MTHPPIEEQIAQWRMFLLRRAAIRSVDVAELEDHLREQMGGLVDTGLAPDEAFLVAVKRMGNVDALSREFAMEHSDRLWKQLVVPAASSVASSRTLQKDGVVAFALAIGAAVTIKLPTLFGKVWGVDEVFYARNISLFVLPFLAAYFIWKRGLGTTMTRGLAVVFALAAVIANVHPFESFSHTLILSMVHLPIALWLVVGIAYAGTRWKDVAGRMDYIRFTGELFIYFVLLALGGGVLIGFIAAIFTSIGMNPEALFESWLLPCGAAGGVIVAAWLVEAKQSVIENMAPVLARLFMPMFTIVLLVFLGTLVVTGRGMQMERELLLVFDLVLILVLALLLYSVSARDAQSPPGVFDIMQLVLLVSALVADAVALSAIAERITEFGFTPNRVAVLGVNVILLVNLARSAFLSLQFIRGRGSFASLERWQTNYLPVYAVWAAVVVIAFPPLFSYA